MEYQFATAITVPNRTLELATRLQDPETFLALCEARHASSTRCKYAKQGHAYCRWCRVHDRVPVPALPETILDYLTERAKRLAWSTIRADATAIAYLHTHLGYPRPDIPQIADLLKGLKQRRPQQPAEAFRPYEIAAICDLLDREPNQDLAARNRALVLLGLQGAFRRSEVCGLWIPDLTFTLQGVEVYLERSKMCAEGRRIAIWRQRDRNLCAVRALEQWLRILQRDRGPLFPPQLPGGGWAWRPISDATFYGWFKQITALFPGHYSPHSLRATNVTWQIDAGADTSQIKRVTGHKSDQSIRHNDRFTNPWATPNFAEALLCP